MNEQEAWDDWEWWWGAWRGVIRCGECRALMRLDGPCPICSKDYRNEPDVVYEINGIRHVIPPVFQGPLDWSPYLLLKVMYRDWRRPLLDDEDSYGAREPAQRAVIVLLFWGYFETLMRWYYEAATSHLPPNVSADLLNRHAMIGRRLDRLHRILFDCTFSADLDSLGHSPIRAHLETLQDRRNKFAHGDAEAIDDALIDQTVRFLPQFHRAWIALFNQRCTKLNG